MLDLIVSGLIAGVGLGIVIEILEGLFGETIVVGFAAIIVSLSFVAGDVDGVESTGYPAVVWIAFVVGFTLQLLLGGEFREGLQTDDGTPYVLAKVRRLR